MKDLIDLSQMRSTVVQVGQYQRVRRYWSTPSPSFWEEIWHKAPRHVYWSQALRGHGLGDYESVYRSHLPTRGSVLEAGCGLGQVVLALRYWGYEAYGLDNAGDTIQYLRSKFPHTPFYHGDIRNLPFRDGVFDGYISLGVIEHSTDGQDQVLAEAHRVLRPHGTIFLSVPAFNAYRRLRARFGLYNDSPAQLPFFEDCYSLEELDCLLRVAGFSPLEILHTNPVLTLVQESFLRPLYRFIEDKRLPRVLVDRGLTLLLPRAWFGHMVMMVAERCP
jgi:SAM-dependent methyltransferase